VNGATGMAVRAGFGRGTLGAPRRGGGFRGLREQGARARMNGLREFALARENRQAALKRVREIKG